MSTPTLILGNNKWAIEEDSILGYAVEDRNGSYLPREISFTRGSDATFTTSTGVIQQACWNLARYSEDFTNAAWVSDGTVTVTANATTAPDGNATADRLQMSNSQRRYVYQTITPSQTTYTYSIYLRANSNQSVRIGIDQSCTFYRGALICNVTNEWQRFTLTVSNITVGTVVAISIDNITSNVTACAGTASNVDLFVWGAQIVQGSDALGYLRTTDRLNMPRVDSSTGTKAFLVEPQRTNTMLYSQAINSWAVKTELTITDNYATSPDGTQNASYIQQTTGGNAVIFQSQNINITTGQSQTVTFYAKAKEVTSITLRLGTTALWSGGVRPAFTCNLLTGSISVGTGTATVSSQNVGGGWYRFIVTTPATLTSGLSTLQTPTGTVLSSTSGDGFYLWGVQWEQNASYPTTYIPTAATTVTRIADTASKTGIIGLLGSTEYTLFWQGSHIATGQYNSFMTVFQTSNTNNSARFFRNNTNNEIRAAIFNSSNGLAVNLVSNVTTTRAKCALRVKNGDFALFVNGVKVNSNTTALDPSSTLDEINLQYFNTSQSYDQNCEMASFFKTALDDAECISITTL